MKPRDGFYFLLASPFVYRLFRTIVLGDGCGVYLSEYVQPVPGEKVLASDAGQGTFWKTCPP